MNLLDKLFTKVISYICIGLMAIMSSLVIINVILRYVFSVSFVWSEELITFLFLATTYFGITLGVRYDEHIRIDFLIDKLGKGGRIISNTINSLIIGFVQVVVFIYSIKWIEAVGNVQSPGLRIPIKFIYYLMPMSSVVICFYLLLSLFTDIKRIQKERVMEGL